MSIKATLRARQRRRRILWASILVGVVAVLLAVYFIAAGFNGSYSPLKGTYVPSSVMQQLTGVQDSTLLAIGSPSGVTPPAKITGTPLTSGNKPEVIYIGGEFCPYCAVERWSMIVALSHFGTFSGVEYWQSSATDLNAMTPTFTFANATFTSGYITFVPVEEFGQGGTSDVRQQLTSQQTTLISQYDTCAATGSSGGIPFIDIANAYAVNCGAQFSLPNAPGSPAPNIVGMNWTQIASQLDTPSSQVAQLIDGAANTLITAICNVDGGQPASVCGQSYATLTLAFQGGAAPSSSTLAVAPEGRYD